jgi:multidrug efflux system outer membrane protein
MVKVHRIGIVAAGVTLWLTGCMAGPNYKRPVVNTPATYRGLAPDQAQPQTAASIADQQWVNVFHDEALQALIQEALKNNYDLRIAATHVLEARDNLGIVRANQLPSLSGIANVNYQRTPPVRADPTLDTLGLQASWALDFWGEYRRATEAARATLLATEAGQNAVRSTLVSSVASAYYQLRELDNELVISQATLTSRQEALRLTTLRVDGGYSAATDLYSAQVLVSEAKASIASTESSIEQSENAITTLLGRNPGPIARGKTLQEQALLPDVPAGLPSSLLERRPDLLAAEQNLVAANANVGVAKALYFPQISLTGTFGASSTSLLSLLSGPGTFWNVGPQLVQPLFQGGRITANYHLAQAQRDEAELTYKETALEAFQDVSSALIAYRKGQQFRTDQEQRAASYQEGARLAKLRYDNGVTSFLEYLYIEQQYFSAELQASQARLLVAQSYVNVYQSLGGGWQQ